MLHTKATQDAPLRHNCVETFDEFNTGKNIGRTAPYIMWDIVPGRDDVEIFPLHGWWWLFLARFW